MAISGNTASLRSLLTARGAAFLHFLPRPVLVLLLALFFAPSLALANSCTSKATGNWSSSATWQNCGSVVPTAADSVTILNGHNITMDSSPTISSMTVNSGGTLSADANNHVLTLTTTAAVPFTNNGTFAPNNSTVVINGNAALTLTSGNITFYNLTLSPTITVARTYTFGAGTIAVNNDLMINPTASTALALTVNMAAPLTVTGLTTVTRTTSATTSFSTTASNFALTTGRLSVLAGGTFTANGSLVRLTGTSGTLLTGGGTFTAGTSTIEFDGDGTSTLTSNTAFTFNNLTLAPTITANRAYTFGTSALTVSGQFNITPNAASAFALTANLGAAATVTGATTVQGQGSATATLDTTASNYALTTSSLTIASAGTVNANGSTITLNTAAAVPFTNAGTFNPGTSTVVINGNAALTLTSNNASTFYNLSLTPTITVARTYTFGSGVLTVNSNLTVNPTASTALALTVNLGTTTSVGGTTTVTRTTSATSTLSTTASNFALTTGLLSIQASGTFQANGSTVTLTGTSGTLFTNAGTFTAGTSRVRFQSDATVTLTSNNAITFYDLELSPTLTAGRTYTFGTTAPTIGHDLLIQPDAASAQALSVNLGSAITVTNNVTVDAVNSASSSLSTTASNFAITAGRLDIESGGTLTANAATITLNGTSGTLFTNNGTFTAGTSIVSMTPDASITATSGPIVFSTITLSPTITASRTYTFGTGAISAQNMQIKPTASSAFALNVVAGDDLAVTAALNITRVTSATANYNTTSSNHLVTAGTLLLQSGASFTANGSTITLNGTTSPPLTAVGTFTAGTSRVRIQSDATVTLTSNNAVTFYDLELSPTITGARTYTFPATSPTIGHDLVVQPGAGSALALTVNEAAALTVANNLTVAPTGSATSNFSTTSSNFALTAGRIDLEAGGTLTGNAATITLNGTSGTLFTNNGTFTAGTSIVNMTPDASITATSGTVVFSTITLSPTITASRTYTFGNAALTAQNVQVRPTASSAFALNVVAGNDLSVTGALVLSRVTSATSNFDTTASNYAVTAGALQIQSGGSFTANGSTITLNGTTSPPLTAVGTFTPGTSRVKIQSDAAVTLTSNNAITFYDLELSPTITVARTYTFPATAPTINHDLSVLPNAASALALTVTMASALSIPNGTLTIDGQGSATSSFSTSASNFALSSDYIVIGAGDTLTGNASTITLTGGSGTLFTNNGTFTAGTSIVAFTPDADVTATAGNITFSTLTVTPTITASRSYGLGSGTISAASMTIRPNAASANNLDVNLGNALTVTGTLTVARSGSATSDLDTSPSNYAITAANAAVQAGGLLIANGSTITLTGTTGTLLTAGGTINPGASTVVMNPNAAVTLTSGAMNLNNLTLSPTITVARTYTFGSGALTLSGDLMINPTASSALALTVNMGSSITVSGLTTVTRTTSATAALSTVSSFALETGQLNIATGGTLTANAATIRLDGTTGTLFTNNGTFTAGTSIVTFAADADVTATAGTITFSTLTVTPALTANHTLALGSGALTAANMTILPSAASPANLDVTLGNTLTVTGALTVNGIGSATSNLDTTAGNFALNAANAVVQAGGTLTTNGSTITLSGTTGTLLTVAGYVEPGASTVVMTPDAGVTLTSGGINLHNLTLSPTITAARAYTFGAAPVTVAGDLMINPTASSAFALTVTMGSSVTVGGLTTITRTTSATSTLSTGSNYTLETGQLNIATSGTLTANASTIRLTGSTGPLFTKVGTFTVGTSTVQVETGGSPALNSGAITFNGLTLSATGQTVTLGAAVTATALTVSSGTLNDAGFQIAGVAGGRLNVSPNATLRLGSAATATTFPTVYTAPNCHLDPASTVVYHAGVAQTVSGTPTYGNLTIDSPSGTPTKTLGAAINVAGALTIGAGNTLSTSGSNFAMTLGGDYTNNGTFTVNTASVTFTTASTSALGGTLNGASAFNTVVLNGAGTVTPGSAMTINGPLTLTQGTLAGSSDVTVAGAVTGAGTIALTGGTFLQRVGAAQTFGSTTGSADWTFNNLTFSNSSAADRVVTVNGTGTGTIVVNGALTVGSASDTNLTTLDDNTNDRVVHALGDVNVTSKGVLSGSGTAPMSVGGNWTLSGVYTHNNGEVVFVSAVIHQLSGATTFYALRALVSGATMQFMAGTTTYVEHEVDFENVGLMSPTNGATWYFRMEGSSETLTGLVVRDSNGSSGNEMDTFSSTNLGNNLNWDFGAPGQVTTLAASPSTTGRAVTLTWQAPGNDGATGTLNNCAFTIHYTTDTAFASGSAWNPTAALPLGVSSVTISTNAVSPGALCTTDLTSLISGGTYYVRIWTNDQRGLYSPISNGATNWATLLVLGIQMSQSAINFGSLNPGTTSVIVTPITMTNTGNVSERFELSINNPATWTATSLGAGSDQFRLTGLFRTSQPASTDFDAANDVITTSTTTATTTVYARDADADTEKAINVPPGATRNLWFQVEMPPQSTTVNPQVVHLTGNARE